MVLEGETRREGRNKAYLLEAVVDSLRNRGEAGPLCGDV